MECMTRIQIGRHWPIGAISEGCFWQTVAPRPHCRIDVPPPPHWLVWWPSALHYKAYKAYKALARAIVQFNHSIACLCEWYELQKQNLAQTSRKLMPKLNFPEPNDFAWNLRRTSHVLRSWHVPCVLSLFFPCFSFSMTEKAAVPIRMCETTDCGNKHFGNTHFWYIDTSFRGACSTFFQLEFLMRLGCPKVRNMFQVHLPFPMALLTSDIDSIQYHQHSCIQPGPGPARVCRYIYWWLKLLVSQAQLTAAVWRDLGKAGGSWFSRIGGPWCWW